MPIPKLDDESRKKPICYDPGRKKFIYFDEIVSGKEKIIPIESLGIQDLKKLIIQRHRLGRNYKVQAISGPLFSRDDVIRAIEKDEPFGRETVEGESTHLRELLSAIQSNLP